MAEKQTTTNEKKAINWKDSISYCLAPDSPMIKTTIAEEKTEEKVSFPKKNFVIGAAAAGAVLVGLLIAVIVLMVRRKRK